METCYKHSPKFHNQFLMAGWVEMVALAGEGQKILMVTVSVFYASKTVTQVAAIQDIPEIGTKESIDQLKSFFVTLD